MAARNLPDRPNLDQLRTQAKDLLRAARRQEPTAMARLGARAFRRNGAEYQLADALRTIAHEYGFSSWATLKVHVEHLRSAHATPSQVEQLPRRRRGPRQTPSGARVQQLQAAVSAAARVGEPFPFIFAAPLGPLPRSIQLPLRQALVASGDLPIVVDVLLRGAEHPNPKVRVECAHAMDWLADERCLATLLRLADDPVPRVRWFALHSLACDDCKLRPLSSCPGVAPLLASRAETDPSARVRRRAADALRLLTATGLEH